MSSGSIAAAASPQSLEWIGRDVAVSDIARELSSLREATSLKVGGDWTFGTKVKVVGDVELETAAAERIPPGSVLEHD